MHAETMYTLGDKESRAITMGLNKKVEIKEGTKTGNCQHFAPAERGGDDLPTKEDCYDLIKIIKEMSRTC